MWILVCITDFHNQSVPIGAVPRCCGYYGEGSGPVLLQQVSCTGSEENITSCPNLTSIIYNHQNDVGVQCQQGY